MSEETFGMEELSTVTVDVGYVIHGTQGGEAMTGWKTPDLNHALRTTEDFTDRKIEKVTTTTTSEWIDFPADYEPPEVFE